MKESSVVLGATPSHGDFNVYHHLANARRHMSKNLRLHLCRLVEEQCVPDSFELSKWME